MPRFKHLPKSQRYRCRECGKSDFGNFFAYNTLCKKCAAKRRTPSINYTKTLSNGLEVTNRVENRLRKDAQKQLISSHPQNTVPYTLSDRIANAAIPIGWLSFVIIVVLSMRFLDRMPGLVLVFLWVFLPILIGGAIGLIFFRSKEFEDTGRVGNLE